MAASHPTPQLTPIELALAEVSKATEADFPPLKENTLSFLRYIPSPQEEYEYLYKALAEAEANWE